MHLTDNFVALAPIIYIVASDEGLSALESGRIWSALISWAVSGQLLSTIYVFDALKLVCATLDAFGSNEKLSGEY